ncbi:LacI family DNA-binding transcriptional regulator [Clostridium sp. AN503]|uniref:LacI family DNA-binding transcriptional regulator n=1 Tax=Clostridium sp. AN503 TaxID=3160598 RepID=UPI00345A9668
MATIKDVAKSAGVSVTTVSIIINGKSEERKISAATQERVQDAMRELGYQPNLSARRLRSQDSKKPVIAFFWPLDYRTSILASFMNSLQVEIQRIGFDCELVIQTYENDKLDQYDASILKNGYSGIVIGACSNSDLKYLEQLSPQMPLILINRYSEHFSTVCTDNREIGLMAARQFRQRGYTEAAVIASQHSYVATGLRTQAFLYACSQLGINVLSEHIFKNLGTIGGGYHAAEAYCNTPNPPKVIFCDSDAMAIGALSAFHKHQKQIPEDVEILSIAMLDPEHAEHTIPPLSVIKMPNEEIGKQLVDILQEKITTNNLEPTHINLEATLVLRESFLGIPKS